MIKGLGRIVLLAAGGFMLVTGLVFMFNGGFDAIKNVFANLGEIFKQMFQGDFSGVQVFSGFFKNLALILVGLISVFAGLKGKAGFWTFIVAAIIAGVIGWDIYNKAKAGDFKNAATVWNYVLTFIGYFGFFAGYVLLKLGRDKKAA